MTLEEAQEIVQFSRTPFGHKHYGRIAKKLEDATKILYFEQDNDKLRSAQGEARALYNQLHELERASEAVAQHQQKQ